MVLVLSHCKDPFAELGVVARLWGQWTRRARLRRSDTCVPVSLGGPSVAGHLLEGETSSSSLAGEAGGLPWYRYSNPHFTASSKTEHSHPCLAHRKRGVSQADSLLVAHTQLFAMDLEGGGRG